MDEAGRVPEGLIAVAGRAREFSWRSTRDGRVFIAWRGRQVKVLTGAEAGRFVARIEGVSEDDAQLEMARVTGNFKRGNERR
jgi:hypothetical protein